MRIPARRLGFLGLILVLALAVMGCNVGELFTRPDSAADEGLAIRKFVASAREIASGGTVTLSWEVVGASGVELDNGIGTVAARGTREVRPTATTIYTLGARADNAAAAHSVRVIVR
jgi:hypothetical protein